MTDQPKPPAYPTKIADMVEQYVRLRDTLAEADKKHKEKTAGARAYLEGLNGALLDAIQQVGGDSVKTPHGTAYRTIKKSATIADGAVFRGYVIANQSYDLVDWRANASAVSKFSDDNGGQLPPGVNYSTVSLVGVRRA